MWRSSEKLDSLESLICDREWKGRCEKIALTGGESPVSKLNDFCRKINSLAQPPLFHGIYAHQIMFVILSCPHEVSDEVQFDEVLRFTHGGR